MQKSTCPRVVRVWLQLRARHQALGAALIDHPPCRVNMPAGGAAMRRAHRQPLPSAQGCHHGRRGAAAPPPAKRTAQQASVGRPSPLRCCCCAASGSAFHAANACCAQQEQRAAAGLPWRLFAGLPSLPMTHGGTVNDASMCGMPCAAAAGVCGC